MSEVSQKLTHNGWVYKQVFEYGGFVELHTLPSGKAGFPFGFPSGVFYLKRGYKGQTKIAMLELLENGSTLFS